MLWEWQLFFPRGLWAQEWLLQSQVYSQGSCPKSLLLEANPLFCPQKIRAVYDSNPAKFKTLQNILEVEKELHGSAWPKTGATLALMWLKR